MASIDKRSGGEYRARWRVYPGGPQRTRHFTRKVDAERHLVKIQHDLLTGTYVDPEKARITVGDFYAAWSARQPWRASTRASVATRFKMHVIPVLGDRPLGSLRRGDIESWVATRPLAPSTAGIALQQLSSMLEAAVGDGLIARNPARGVKRPRRDGSPVVPFTSAEVEQHLAGTAPWFAIAVVLGARCGLRHGESAGLTIDRVDFLRRQLKVDRQLVTTKAGGLGTSFGPLKTANSYRAVPLADSTVASLAAHVREFGTGEGGLLVHEQGRPVNAARFGYLWRQARKAADIGAAARYHDTRHTFASVLLSDGVSVAAVAEYLGDTPAVVLNTYAHLMPADHDRARAAIEAAARRAEDSLRTGEGSRVAD